jgi:hypothetical protein
MIETVRKSLWKACHRAGLGTADCFGLFPQYDPFKFPSKYVGTGGKLVGEKRTNASNLSGTGIEGGTPQRISKGDYTFVPENTPHSFTKTQGTLVIMSIHVPRGG